MAKYKIAPGKSLVANRRVYGPGEEITEDCFGDKKTITELLKNGSILEASEKAAEAATEKKSKKASKTESASAEDTGAEAE